MDSTSIKSLRKRLSLTQEEMAWLCNVSVSSIRAWEQGVRSPGGAAIRLMQNLDEDARNNPSALPAIRRKLRPNMPTVATVAGVRVMIFYNDHSPPHVHLSKGDMDLVVNIRQPRISPLAFTRSDRRAVLAWMRERRDALLAAWERARRGENPGGIE